MKTITQFFKNPLVVFIFCFSLFINQAESQTPAVANLVATGTGIKWYSASSGGTALAPSTALVNGQHYWASQTVNGCESTTRFEVTATIVTQTAPASGTHSSSKTEVVWNWNSASGVTGYKWSTTNNYGGATDMGSALTKTETGLTCNTAYTRYVWAYDATGCASGATTLTQSTTSCALAIGDSYQGRKIAYLDGTGLHGFISANSDLDGKRWGTYDYAHPVPSGASGTAIGTGQANTTKIVTVDPLGAAAIECDNYTNADEGTGVYSDWYLPSLDELHQMWVNRTVLGLPSSNELYWSSTEMAGNVQAADAVRFTDGVTQYQIKSAVWSVRPIRSF